MVSTIQIGAKGCHCITAAYVNRLTTRFLQVAACDKMGDLAQEKASAPVWWHECFFSSQYPFSIECEQLRIHSRPYSTLHRSADNQCISARVPTYCCAATLKTYTACLWKYVSYPCHVLYLEMCMIYNLRTAIIIHMWNMTASIVYIQSEGVNSCVSMATQSLSCDMLIIGQEIRNCLYSIWMKSFQQSRQLRWVNIIIHQFGKYVSQRCHRFIRLFVLLASAFRKTQFCSHKASFKIETSKVEWMFAV